MKKRNESQKHKLLYNLDLAKVEQVWAFKNNQQVDGVTHPGIYIVVVVWVGFKWPKDCGEAGPRRRGESGG